MQYKHNTWPCWLNNIKVKEKSSAMVLTKSLNWIGPFVNKKGGNLVNEIRLLLQSF